MPIQEITLNVKLIAGYLALNLSLKYTLITLIVCDYTLWYNLSIEHSGVTLFNGRIHCPPGGALLFNVEC